MLLGHALNELLQEGSLVIGLADSSLTQAISKSIQTTLIDFRVAGNVHRLDRLVHSPFEVAYKAPFIQQ